MIRKLGILCFSSFALLLFLHCNTPEENPYNRKMEFNDNWQFQLLDSTQKDTTATWRTLSLPHDWSIEGSFDEKHPATFGGGALPGGLAFYKKEFKLPRNTENKKVYIQFDGVYMNSEVWINDHHLGKRPNGYISFEYDLTPWLNREVTNTLVVKVDNSQQPNSRWYSGSGIYRNVWLNFTDKLHIKNWGTYVTTPEITNDHAKVHAEITVMNHFEHDRNAVLRTSVLKDGVTLELSEMEIQLAAGTEKTFKTAIEIVDPELWSVENPEMYTLMNEIISEGITEDLYETPFGIRDFKFDAENGFLLNGKQVKIKGVCNHHDLGALGTAINIRALERQLEILKEMGVNGIRTAHNPPAPELLELCDRMGFIVMDEVFDMWKKGKSAYDYHLYWDEWHEKDLVDFIKRDRNHPSVFVWSIGNEILEQWDSTGVAITRELAATVRKLDTTRPITTANNPPSPTNSLNASGVLDLVGYNYALNSYEDHLKVFPGMPFIATETTSALETRGYYDQRSDTIKRWPYKWDELFLDGNPGNTVSSYDQVSAPWGSTHEETWKVIKKHDYMSGMYIWTGFDYIGEPTPYVWPSKSSYFGIIDLAGFPKDVYYMYQSEWTDKDVLHVFPHWNWKPGEEIDIWAYYNHADEVELFLNGESLGIRSKAGDDLHVMWRVPFTPGTVRAVSRKDGKIVKEQEIKTAGKPEKIGLHADRAKLDADGKDLAFITVTILDKEGNIAPIASDTISFEIEGPGSIAGVDNGNPVSHESFKGNQRKAFYGKCLVIVKAGEVPGGIITLTASGSGLESQTIEITTL
ncbi:glycoside hydrolase family 2 TIM barrel-domain containing protein [Robertkochia solimangrovi]|uniref:glycoside hydrolase family 2 TIM barrel-domain containing protein n=1 Tax=Robertkochia solimangrovi TaxID=2213046 RepID=UPI00117E1388|nr:glycoside hydrolase family 2 TIM barrel-domain containing protein [Robertkochia solimangrovi]TRZ42293.1 glycoside hydrolase family 2 [Robertkochia solimangrovi]